jgi:tetratricopeptide (TPR) repeat protein
MRKAHWLLKKGKDHKKELEIALKLLTKALTIESESKIPEYEADTYMLRGLVYYMLGDYDKAKKDWKKGLEIDPEARKRLPPLK